MMPQSVHTQSSQLLKVVYVILVFPCRKVASDRLYNDSIINHGMKGQGVLFRSHSSRVHHYPACKYYNRATSSTTNKEIAVRMLASKKA